MKKAYEEDKVIQNYQINDDVKKVELNKIEIESINRVYDKLSNLINYLKYLSQYI